MINPARAAILRDQIAALEGAEITLVSGKSKASVSYDGTSASFTQSRLPDLLDVLARKRRELAKAEGRSIRPKRFRA